MFSLYCWETNKWAGTELVETRISLFWLRTQVSQWPLRPSLNSLCSFLPSPIVVPPHWPFCLLATKLPFLRTFACAVTSALNIFPWLGLVPFQFLSSWYTFPSQRSLSWLSVLGIFWLSLRSTFHPSLHCSVLRGTCRLPCLPWHPLGSGGQRVRGFLLVKPLWWLPWVGSLSLLKAPAKRLLPVTPDTFSPLPS